MKISYNWLKRYIEDIPKEEDLANLITFKICELEGIEKLPNGDTIFDINILPNRAHDLLSHRGVAEEIAKILNKKIKEKEIEEIKEVNKTNLNINVESKLCKRYIGRIVRNIEIRPSPSWLSDLLESIGARSINNIVDITNFILFDTGQPIHIFDLDKLNSQKVFIRRAKKGENIELLSFDNLDKKRTLQLNENNLIIANGESGLLQNNEPLALAGVKGGKKAEVDSNTKNILIEVANFDPKTVRKTALGFGIQTDAVKRFENEISPILCEEVMDITSSLIKDICKESLFEEIVDIYEQKNEEVKKISFSGDYIEKILGTKINNEEIEKILKNYNYNFSKKGDIFEVIIPYNRLDLNIKADMAEEIGRIYGYEKIIPILPKLDLEQSDNEVWNKICLAKMQLIKDLYREVMTYTFADKGEVSVMASASDKNFLRTNLTDGLKKSYELNRLNASFLQLSEIKIFEIGTIFKKDKEEMHVAYNEKKEFKEMTLDEFIVFKKIDIKEDILNASFFGSLSPRARGALTLGSSACETPKKESIQNKKFKMWSLYPFIVRDIALWTGEGAKSDEILEIIKNEINELVVVGPYLFDEFKKDGRISYAFRLIFQSYERTLTDVEVNKVMNKITTKLSQNKDWELR